MMAGEKADVLLLGPKKPLMVDALSAVFNLHMAAEAKDFEAFQVKVVYHSRKPQSGVTYKHYPDLIAMPRDVDILLTIVPGGPTTQNMINAAVLDALGPEGIFINMARGSVVDEAALIKALKERRILSAGLHGQPKEPGVHNELIA